MEPNNIIEFSGGEGTGKSELLMNIAAQCVLPKSLSGCGCDVIFINTDYKFNIVRFISIIEKRLKLLQCEGSSEHFTLDRTFLDSILSHFHLFYCPSVSECCMALMNTLNSSSISDVGAIIIDDMGLLWENKNDAYIEDLVEIFKKLVKERRLLMAVSQLLPVYGGQLFRSWLKLVSYKFKLTMSTCTNDMMQTDVLIQQIHPKSEDFYKFSIN